ncbi:MAG: DNA mismatch repair protein MutS [Oscillospiraceae bacterium]|jgi:DNA mismatch repair protein MutS|nr:DNA mismatch repair protein MutS [Oscillospiraceae bacterium]
MAITPMMKQYNEIKSQAENCILFFRLGDFYEMFGEDARLASKELDLVLTSRDRGAPEDERTPMCGVPYHSAEAYIKRLVDKGYNVAICEQTEDPSQAQGIVKRDIVRIITPGTAIESSMLDESKNNFISSVFMEGDRAGVSFCDLSTGETFSTEHSGKELAQSVLNELGRFVPAEVILNAEAMKDEKLVFFISDRLGCAISKVGEEDKLAERAEKIVTNQFRRQISELGFGGSTAAVLSCAGLLQYLYNTQKTDLGYIRTLEYYDNAKFMELDTTARRNLELCETMRSGEKKGSLLWVLDKTGTPMGGRLIRSWIEKPLLNPAMIKRRLQAVDEIKRNPQLTDELKAELNNISDIERIIARVVYGSANCRDLRHMSDATGHLPKIKKMLTESKTPLLKELYSIIDELEDITGLIEGAIVEDPPFSVKEGGFIKEGFNRDVDELHGILSGSRGGVAGIEAREKKRTGIKTLKVGYNRVFGYYIEVRKSGVDMIPEEYIRKQTLSDRERYITQELKDMEYSILTANERLAALEYELFNEIRQKIYLEIHRIQRTAQAIAQLDVLRSLAQAARDENYCCPEVDYSDRIEIIDGRHCVVEKMLSSGMFVPNDTIMDNSENLTAIITGPNMAGKSTYMRQVALITLMAQVGSFVPARSATIGVCDRIFTRIGASDDLASGQSTFMVEMSEVAEILRCATGKSLLILDEIGRGTSTYDGMSIARAVLEWVSDKKRLGAKTLFATHYHELTELEGQFPGVKNYNIAVKKRNKEIIFLRKIVGGAADDSYGIEVARLAGIPEGVISRADNILEQLEAGESWKLRGKNKVSGEIVKDREQVSVFDVGDSEIRARLLEIDLNILTPIEAMNILYELKKKADRL